MMIIMILAANIPPPSPDIGLHEARALFATFTSLNPLSRPGTLTRTGSCVVCIQPVMLSCSGSSVCTTPPPPRKGFRDEQLTGVELVL